MSEWLPGGMAGESAFLRRRLTVRGPVTRLLAGLAAAGLVGALLAIAPAAPSQAACGNPVVCENQLPGTPQSAWDVTSPSTTIQGFADPFSVNIGSSVNFKIESPASSYKVDIYRMGYYGGNGARLVTSLTPNVIRFYKGAGNTGTHVGSLWTASGTLLGQVTFTNESASGWQEADFSSPIPVTAGTTYVASYFAPNGGYSVNSAYFASAGVSNGPLTAPQSSAVANGNGVYVYGSAPAFPNSSYNATNYWVDVVFTEP